MLDWNISNRIANIHRRQTNFQPLNLSTVEIERLRNLLEALPEDVDILSAFAAAEPETRRTARAVDSDRYNERADIASVYLSHVPDYLLHLLRGGVSGGLVIESHPDGETYQPEVFRRWFMLSYAALLKAASIYREGRGARTDRVDDFRFWLEHELRFAASREAWVGFMLLGGTGDHPGKMRRFLKLDGSGDLRDSVWGATWDLMYTRIPSLMATPNFRGLWKLPMVFVTDDTALVEALAGITTPLIAENANGVYFSGDSMDLTALHEDVRPIVRDYMRREIKRVMTASNGISDTASNRAAYLARRIERHLDSL